MSQIVYFEKLKAPFKVCFPLVEFSEPNKMLFLIFRKLKIVGTINFSRVHSEEKTDQMRKNERNDFAIK